MKVNQIILKLQKMLNQTREEIMNWKDYMKYKKEKKNMKKLEKSMTKMPKRERKIMRRMVVQ